MTEISLAIGVDHRGFELKEYLLAHRQVGEIDISWRDVGCSSAEECDYPPFAQEVARLVKSKEVDAGILSCGTGIGMAVAANRFAGIYAGLVWNPDVARRAKEEDNVNILVIPADYVADFEALSCLEAWLKATFKKEVARYQRRLNLIDAK